ncbi:MAG: C10 family peptidase [Alistipes sp.]|nr:C10 family peptidase [Alistipes sp.]
MKRIFAILILLGASLSLTAAPINESKARKIAEDFFACNTTRTLGVTLEWSGSDLNAQGAATRATVDNPMLYIYNRSDNGGFVIVAGDDSVRPIVAYSFERAFEVDRVSPEAKELLNAWCEQIAAADGESRVVTRADVDLGDVIAEYQTAQWDQGAPFNNECPVFGSARAVTGCVATAMAIICYHNKWPQSVNATTPEYSYTDSSNINQTIPANVINTTYNYDNMLLDYGGGYSATQGAAVAELIHDMGTMVKMSYGVAESSAFDKDAHAALVSYCQYSKSSKLVYHAGYTEEEWTALLQNNLKTYGPTYFSGSGESGGHAFVLDGCTDKGFFQINFGWGGYGNGYFLLPNIEFYEWQQAIIELTPDKNQTSTYEDYLLVYDNGTIPGLLSDATVYEQGKEFEVAFCVDNKGIVDFEGTIALCLCDSIGQIKEKLVSDNTTLKVGYYSWWTNQKVTITSTIETGDRLRIYYKGSNSGGEAQWARAYNPEAVNELIICGSAEDIARSLTLNYTPQYDNGENVVKLIEFRSDMAIQWQLWNEDKSQKFREEETTANTYDGFNFSNTIKGTYWLRVYASGTEYYDLELVF